MKNIYGKKVNKYLNMVFPNKKYSGLALDLGCGNGANSLFLANKGFGVYSMDIDKEVLKNFNHSNIIKLHKNIKQEKFLKKYKVILALNVLQFLTIRGIKKIIPKIFSAVDNGGILFIQMFYSPVIDYINKQLEDFVVIDYRDWYQKDTIPFPHEHHFIQWIVRK